MATDLRVICIDERPLNNPVSHAHIVAIGVGNDPDRPGVWTLAQVVQAIRNNTYAFWTYGPHSGKWARVEITRCSYCWNDHIRSSPDATVDNNLESLPRRVLI